MPRIAGTDIPDKKRLEISLTYVYGVGRNNVLDILRKAEIDASLKASELTPEQIAKLQKIVDAMRVEGDLRKEVSQNIVRLKEIGSYRGNRHNKGLPVRGQRTRTNARTKRGKRMTIGALKKEVMAKVDAGKKEDAKK